MLAEVVAGAMGLLALVAGALAWYNGSRARREKERADAASAAVGALRSINLELRAALERAVASVAARNEREALDDARIATDASSDAGRAADLLNSLHEDGQGPG